MNQFFKYFGKTQLTIVQCLFWRVFPKSLKNWFIKIVFFLWNAVCIIVTKYQYGFQSDKSTTHAILVVLTSAYDQTNYIFLDFDQINNNEFSCITLLDFKKAFDTVCHPIFFLMLEHYGICGVANKLFSFCLTDNNILHIIPWARKQRLFDTVYPKEAT